MTFETFKFGFNPKYVVSTYFGFKLKLLTNVSWF